MFLATEQKVCKIAKVIKEEISNTASQFLADNKT